MNRRILAVFGLITLVFLAGCSFGTNELDGEDLSGDADYHWERNAKVSFDLSSSANGYAAVVHLDNQSTLTLHRETAFRGNQPLDIDDVKFRYQNGTVVNATEAEITAEKNSDETVLYLPEENGTVGYTSSRSGKEFSSPVFVEGSHRLDLPESTRVGIPLLSQVRPNGYSSTVENDQMTLYWESLDGGSISIRYYLVRDLYLFGSLFVVAIVMGVGGVAYYYRQIRRAKRKREEVGSSTLRHRHRLR